MGVIEDGGQIELVSLCTPPFPAIVSYCENLPGDEVLQTLLSDLSDYLGEGFTGINAHKALAERMKDLWEQDTGRKARLAMAMRIYKLEQVIPVEGVPGKLRPAEIGDKDVMLSWYAGFQRDAMLEEPDLARVQKQVNMYLKADPGERGLYFWIKDGQPVSMAGYAGPTPNGIRIGAVYTPPEQRKSGYASAVTAGLSQQLLDQGFKFCFLFTDLLNPTSNYIYQQIGYRPVCDVDRYDFT
jgi:predicted GNAT family acetyltransferase